MPIFHSVVVVEVEEERVVIIEKYQCPTIGKEFIETHKKAYASATINQTATHSNYLRYSNIACFAFSFSGLL